MRYWKQATIVIAAWLLFECAISWFATCQPEHQGGAHHAGAKDHCTLFSGPIITVGRFGVSQVAGFLHVYEHELVAGFTIVLAFSTIGLWLATKHLWEVTGETLTHAEQTAERQLRAYLFLDPKTFELDVRLSEHQTGKDRLCLCKIGYVINNTGQTPAYRVKTESDIRVLGWPPPADLVIEPSPGDTVSQLRGVGAGHPMGGSVGKFVMLDLEAIDALTQRIYFVGVVTYFDVFGKVRHTRFCCSIVGLLDFLKSGLKDTSVLSFEWSQQHNHAD